MKIRKLLSSMCRYCMDGKYRFLINAVQGRYDGLDDEEFVSRKYEAAMGTWCDLTSPVAFNEKLQWLKLYDHNPLYTVMADKVLSKEYVAERIGEKYIIPTLGVWKSPDEIDFATLPDRFVIKCNQNSGRGMYICKDKTKLDISLVKKGLAKGMKQDYYLAHREWPYKDIPRRIIAEQYLENSEVAGLTDYKIHCFNGVPRFVLVCKDRFAETGLTEDFFTPQWEHMDLKRPKIPNAIVDIPKPGKLDEMLSLAEKLSENIPFVRVDFYFVEGRIYFSELTFYPASGFAPFEPEEWDKTFGEWLELPKLDI